MSEYKTNYFSKGTIEWLSLTPEKRGALESRDQLIITKEDGIDGDHKRSSHRQVTLIQKENIDNVASFLNMDAVDPSLLRRNVVISGINLYGFQGSQIKLGEEVVLEITGECDPCATMEKNLGKGGYTAMCGNGGYTCKVIQGGRIKKGDIIEPIV